MSSLDSKKKAVVITLLAGCSLFVATGGSLFFGRYLAAVWFGLPCVWSFVTMAHGVSLIEAESDEKP